MTAAAFVISILALLIAAVSATFTGLNFRLNSHADARKAPQVRTELGTHIPSDLPDGFWPLKGEPFELAAQQDDRMAVAVRAHNLGERPIDVVFATAKLREVDSDYGWNAVPLGGDYGPSMPFTLSNNAGTWWIPLLTVQNVIGQHPGDARRLRGDVEVTFELVLANGDVVVEGPRHIRFLRPGTNAAL